MDPTGRARSVLVADDDAAFRELISVWLEGAGGWRVVIAADGEEACAVVDAGGLDLVLLDLLLPRRDGYAVLLHLRSNPATRGVPVLIVSGEPAAEHATVSAAFGARGFLPKPFSRAELLAAIAAATGSATSGGVE
jgi:CheY-like chemotaxis protein